MKQPKRNYFSRQSGAYLTRLSRDKRCFLKKLLVTDRYGLLGLSLGLLLFSS